MGFDRDESGFVFIEAGPESFRPTPTRRRAFPRWMESMKSLLIAGANAVLGGALMIGAGLRGRKS